LKLYRIASLAYPIFSGVGAGLIGGRWNSVGQQVIYTATSLALARLESLVQIGGLANEPKNLGQIEIDVPDELKTERYRGRRVPASEQRAKSFGDNWIMSKRSLIVFVPSMVSEGDWNALINPSHPDFHFLSPGPEKAVRWDKRLFAKSH
jgi:RES domain-containing protein